MFYRDFNDQELLFYIIRNNFQFSHRSIKSKFEFEIFSMYYESNKTK